VTGIALDVVVPDSPPAPQLGVLRMKSRLRREIVWLFLISLAVRLSVAILIDRPGYVDTAYYSAGAVRLAGGGGLVHPYLWHYLGDPAAVPTEGFLYWMPLPSLLAAPFAALWPGSFLALELPFALLSAILPTVAFSIAWRGGEARRTAWVAGLLTLFSGFFFPYWTIPETFAPFALFGSLALCLGGFGSAGTRGAEGRSAAAVWIGSGLLVGLAHLTRPDGPLLLFVVLGAALFGASAQSGLHKGFRRSAAKNAVWVVLGYALAMAPWLVRNAAVAGSPLPAAGTKTLWLRSYDDIFCFGCDVSAASYLDWGWDNIVRSKLSAVGINLQRFVAEDCLVFLFPFAVLGLTRLRRKPVYAAGGLYLVLAFLLHSLAFTFPGARGGFFHASAAALPIVLAAAAEGLDTAIRWAGARRGWRVAEARAVFTAAAVVAAFALSVYAGQARIVPWGGADQVFEDVEHCIGEGDGPSVVMVNNPPAFWYHTGHYAVAVPNGDVEMLLAAADRYGVSYVVLDVNRPQPLARLHSGLESNARLERICEFGATVVYQLHR
jgi:hypothetical protein